MSVTDLETAVPEPRTPAAGEAVPARRQKSILQLEITPRKVPRKELMHFSRQLAVFIQAGIPILDALDVIREEMGNKLFKEIVGEMVDALRGGSTFADAAAVHESAFPAYYLGILRSAELTGKLDTVLLQLSDYIERDLEARRKVTSALTYPAVIAVVSVVVVVVLVAYVLPRFEVFFDQLGSDLPLPTRMLLGISDFFATWWIAVAGGAVAMVAAAIVTMRTDGGRRLRDRMLLRLPVLGDLTQHVILERFCRILSSMMQAGVPLPDALAVTSDATSNQVYREGLTTARDAMMRGEGLSAPLGDTHLFPASAMQMFRVGESTGSLDQQLATAASYFERELDYKIKRFTNLFEPMVIVGMGLVVGFVAVALVSAMYGIFRSSSL